MKKLISSALLFGATAFTLSCSQSPVEYYPDITHTSSPGGVEVFQADSLSIEQNYTIPDWFTDSKLGIFIHWGVYTVPAYGSEWYARWMYTEGSKINKYHEETYGKLTEFGYKDFIPMFKAEKFDAEQWAKIFKGSGAKYVVPVAEHHDGFSMYHSVVNPWNSVEMGPKIDVIGELSKAIRQEGLIFGLSSHRAENPWFYNGGVEFPCDAQDMSISMYGQRLAKPEGEGMTAEYGAHEGSNAESREQWLKHMYELIDQYQPELIWFDWTVGKYPFQPTFYKFMAYYYNNAVEWGKEVVVNTKVGFSDRSQVFDIERGKSDRIRRYPWQTDTSIGNKSWSYTPDEENKSPNHIIDDFVDIVSKNGNLLLNVGPKVDGTITDEQQYVLAELGAWLKINGEAIYNTRPWVRWSEGNNKGTAGYMTDRVETKYNAGDIRFTSNGDFLYAMCLDWSDEDILISSLSPENGAGVRVKSVSMLGSSETIKWAQTDKGLRVHFPETKPSEYAHAFKIEVEGIVYGDMQADVVAGQGVVVEQYTHNGSDTAAEVELKCSRNGEFAETVTLSIEPHTTAISTFTFNTVEDVNDLELYIDGKKFTTSTLSAAAQKDIHGKTKSVIHNTDALGTKKKN